MPPDEVEGAVGQEVGANVEVACVASAEGEGLEREAVLRHLGVGGGEEGALGLVERAWRWRVVVGVVGPGARTEGGR